MTEFYCRTVRVWQTKDQFQATNKAWTGRPQKNVARPPFLHLFTPFPSLPSSPVVMQWIVVSLFQFAHRGSVLHNVAPGGTVGRRKQQPGQVRREPITFSGCFSTRCKEQSGLIGGDYRRMLIQCHAVRVEGEHEQVPVWLLMSPADKLQAASSATISAILLL